MHKSTYVVLLLLLLSGCSTYIVRSEIGAGTSGPISDGIQPKGKYTSGINTGLKIGPSYELMENLHTDLLAGVEITWPLHKSDRRGRIYSLVGSARLRYTGTEYQPYVGCFIGPSYADNRWEPQSTDYGFVLGVDFGVRKKISNEYWLTFGFRSWHESNGSKVFGSPQPNPGFNMGMLVLGIEW